jgi:putative peptidoglycan lipid II flippase
MIALAPWIGIGAAVTGVIAGTVAQCALQLGPLRRAGVSWVRPQWSFEIWRRIGPAFMPAALASLVAQGNPLADKVIGSYLAAGSITHLNYADMFAGSVAIVTTSVALVTFPTLTTALAEGDPERALRVLRQAVHVNLLTAVPISCLLGAFAPDIVRAVYGWGRLGPSDLTQVAHCLLAYAVGVPFTGLFFVLLRACYAVRRPMYAFVLSLLYFGIHALVAIALAPRLGPTGLAIGTSAGAIATGLGGWFLLRSELLRHAGATAAGTSFRLGLVAAASTVVPFLYLRPWATHEASPADALWRVPLAMLLGAVVLVPLLHKIDPDSGQVLARAWSHAIGRVRDR